MRLSRSFFHTLKEVPKDARIPSHRLMYRAGMIQQAAGGIYSYLPAALRCIRKIENIIRDELNRRGSGSCTTICCCASRIVKAGISAWGPLMKR